MAFPNTPILDNFNTTPLQALTSRAGWSASVLRTGDGTLSTDATPTMAINGAATAGNLWAAAAIPDSESWLTLGTYNPATQQVYLFARVTAQGAATGYVLQIGAPPSTFVLLKFVAGVGTAIGTSKGITAALGDSIGIQVVGSTVSSWYQAGAGAWTLQDSIVDSSISGSGQFGGVFVSAGVGIDAIGGGASSSGSGGSGHSLMLTGVGA